MAGFSSGQSAGCCWVGPAATIVAPRGTVGEGWIEKVRGGSERNLGDQAAMMRRKDEEWPNL
jgi:hypothetical protein